MLCLMRNKLALYILISICGVGCRCWLAFSPQEVVGREASFLARWTCTASCRSEAHTSRPKPGDSSMSKKSDSLSVLRIATTAMAAVVAQV